METNQRKASIKQDLKRLKSLSKLNDNFLGADFDEAFNTAVSQLAEPGLAESMDSVAKASGSQDGASRNDIGGGAAAAKQGQGVVSHDLLDYLIGFHCPVDMDKTSPSRVFAAFSEVRLALLRRLCDEKIAPASQKLKSKSVKKKDGSATLE